MRKKHFVKTSTILLCLALLFSVGLSLQTRATTSKDVTSQVELLGNPFKKVPYARNVWDMQVYNGRIYLGHGDLNRNAGPIPVIYFDPIANEFITQFTVDEEQIEKYKVINGKLYIPGTDATESWTFGNFYAMDDDDLWTKLRTIPKANHVFDMAYYNGNLYASIGATTKDACGLLVSKDMGKTWATVQDNFSALRSWMNNLFVLNNKLYATGDMIVRSSPSSYTKFRNFLIIDENSNSVQPYNNSFLPGATSHHRYNILRAVTVNTNLVYLGVKVTGVNDLWSPDALYVATDINKVRRVVFPLVTALPTDILVRSNTTYVSAYIKNSTTGYTNIVYKSDDLITWTELFRFNTETFARSFEELSGDFYFGLGCNMTDLSASTGNILKVGKTTY